MHDLKFQSIFSCIFIIYTKKKLYFVLGDISSKKNVRPQRGARSKTGMLIDILNYLGGF